MKHIIIWLLLACAALSAQDITVTAEATGEDRAVAKCRERMAEAIADKLCEWRAELWESALPGFPFERAERPMRLGHELASTAMITVEQTGDRWVATGSIQEELVRITGAMQSTQKARSCRNAMTLKNRFDPHRSSLNRHEIGNAIAEALGVYLLPDDAGLVDSLRLFAYNNLSKTVIIRQNDIIVPEGESMTVRIKAYIDDEYATPLQGVDVTISPIVAGDEALSFSSTTQHNGWVVFQGGQRTGIPTIIGDWKCSILPGGDYSLSNSDKALAYEYIAILVGEEHYTFSVRSVGRRKTFIQSDMGFINQILSFFEDEGHTFVSDPAEADWMLSLKLNTLSEGPDGHGGFACVMSATLTMTHDGKNTDVWETGEVEVFSDQSVRVARDKAEMDIRRKLIALTRPDPER